MKTQTAYAVALILLFVTTQASAASPPEFQFFIPNQPPFIEVRDLESDADGNLYVLFSARATRGFNGLQHLIKVSSTGDIVWSVDGDGLGTSRSKLAGNAVAVDSQGRVYVGESARREVRYFSTSTGQFLGKFGSFCWLLNDNQGCDDLDGDGPLELGDGQFFAVSDIAIDTTDRIYIADSGNNRVQVFSAPGVFAFKFGSRCDLDPSLPKTGCVDPDDGGPQELGDGQFFSPNGVAAADDGRIAVADTENNRVQIFDSNGSFLSKLGANGGDGTSGTADGEFNAPIAVNFNSAGSLFVAQRFGVSIGMVQVFSSAGVLTHRFLNRCIDICEPDEVNDLEAIDIDNLDRLLIADSFIENLKIFGSDGVFLGEIGNFGPSPLLEDVHSVDFDLSGNIYVGSGRTIRVYSPTGSFLREISSIDTSISFGDDLAVDSVATPLGLFNRIIVSNRSSDRVRILDSDGEFIASVGDRGPGRCILSTGENCIDPDGPEGPAELGDGQFINQSGIAVGPNRGIYVADHGNSRVQVFDANGDFLFKFGKNGGDGSFGFEDGEFFNTNDIGVGPDARIYVTDRTQRVQVFDPNGGFLFAFGGEQGTGPGQFGDVGNLVVDAFSRVYVSDVSDFFPSPPIITDRIQVFSGAGEFLTEFGELGMGPVQFREPGDIAVGAGGVVAVADRRNNRVQVFQEGPTADLFLSMTGPATVNAGAAFQIQISVSNEGPDEAQQVVVSHTLPPEMSFLDGLVETGFCTEENGEITCGKEINTVACAQVDSDVLCDLGDLIATAFGHVDLLIEVASDAQGLLVSSASIDSNANDPNPADNDDTVVTEIIDSIPPTLIVPDDIVQEATGPGGAIVTFAAEADDNVDGILVPNCSVASGAEFPLGATLVTCTASDNAGNEGTGSFVVSVVDTTVPAITVPEDQEVEATGPDGAVVDFTVTAFDLVDGEIAPSCEPASGSLFPLGFTFVFCSATDAASNIGGREFSVNVVDTLPPDLTIPADIVAEATGPDGQAVDIGTATADDIADPAPAIANDAPALFGPGTTTVTWTATDSAGNSASAVQLVTVVDTLPPDLTIPADIVAEATGPDGQAVDIGTATADDIADPAPAIANDAPALFGLGTTTVTWTATDSAGNSASAVQLVTVADTTPPVLTAPDDFTITASDPRGEIVTFVTSATDVADPSPTIICTPASGSLFVIGAHTVECRATDAAGNFSDESFVVDVIVGPETFDGLADIVQSLGLPRGSENSLLRKIASAKQHFEGGRIGSSIAKLNDFINEVGAQSGKTLDAADAALLQTVASLLIAHLT